MITKLSCNMRNSTLLWYLGTTTMGRLKTDYITTHKNTDILIFLFFCQIPYSLRVTKSKVPFQRAPHQSLNIHPSITYHSQSHTVSFLPSTSSSSYLSPFHSPLYSHHSSSPYNQTISDKTYRSQHR